MTEKQHNHVLVSTCSVADAGRTRERQEDSLGYVNIPPKQKMEALLRGHLYVVADGIGGSKGGEIASRVAIESIIKSYYTLSGSTVQSVLKEAILRANEQILAESVKRKLPNMGSTVVCAVLCDGTLYVAHLGDSRAYLLREGELKRLTTDHSHVQTLIEKGELSEEEAPHHPQYHKITHALGTSSSIEPEINRFRVSASDQLLLCSDGLHDELSDQTIKKLLLSGGDQQTICSNLVQRANLAGGRDNISLILTRVEGLKPLSVSKTYTELPRLNARQIEKWKHEELASPSASQEGTIYWSQREPSSWWLGLTTVILAALLILQTIWFQSEYRTMRSDLDRAQKGIETIINRIDQEGYGEVDDKLIQDLIKAQPQPEQPLNTRTPFVIAPKSDTDTPNP
ncbi:MAG: Stp1/IreP family PP2C-type Ser/Thr phosphatase [Ardenticatenaceae bacterium]